MSFAIKHGLFKLNIIDHHAILGTALNANPKEIRLKYLKIAHKLHPDTCKGDNEHKKLASKLLSRLVNPAYESLSNKNSYAEHQLILTQIGQRLVEKKDRITFASESAQQLLQAGDKLELVYHKLLKSLSQEQYNSLESVTKKIALISELNLVYLMLQQSRTMILTQKPQMTEKSATSQSPKSPTSRKAPTQPSPPQTSEKPEPPKTQLRVASYIRRAKEYTEKGNWLQAIAELKDGLKIDPNNSTIHALLGKIYLRQQQLTMAKIHIKKAEQVNPKDPIVIESKKELDQLLKHKNRQNTGAGKSSKSRNTNTSESKLSNSGIFRSLFGAKKK
ncbi:MAG: tetratricopeptide repeat protein [Xenococcaceae cyanobacterium MO_167.B27]|nr:tetratricopeptide repeat protein [Xenococcaceae cyanobacterium MO_167.B27]